MDINDTVFVTDAKNRKIYEATLVGIAISESGYKMMAVLNAKGQRTLTEEAHVHKTKPEAQQFMDIIKPIIEEMEELNKTATERLNELREDIIGEADYPELAERIMKGVSK